MSVKHRPTIKDVASAAGVSTGTVSNVLNRPDQVGPALRTRVEAAISELGFVPDEHARRLRARRPSAPAAAGD
jgi:LacI family transcriptional regulator